MNHVHIINEFHHVIEAEARRIEQTAQRNAHVCIRAICRCFEFGEYDWKNSPEGFDNWVERNFATVPFAKAELLRQWQIIEDADAHFRQVFFGIRRDADG